MGDSRVKRSSKKTDRVGHRRYVIAVALAGLAMCSGPFRATSPFGGARTIATTEQAGVATFPEIAPDWGELEPLLTKALRKSTKAMSPDELQPLVARIRHYLLFLGL